VDEASLAQGRARPPEEQPYRYPDAVEMARVRALKEHYVRMSRLSRMSR